jgi:hypothetical protein
MDFAIPSKSLFTSIGEFFSPPNRAIGPMPRTEQSTPMRPTPIAMRSPKQQLKDGGSAPLAKRASGSVPFSTRFALLVFSVRLKFTKSAAGLDALKNDVKSFKKGAKEAGLSSTVDVLETMLSTIEVKRNPHLAIPLAGGPGFRY